jgi:Galactose oxidase, central domain
VRGHAPSSLVFLYLLPACVRSDNSVSQGANDCSQRVDLGGRKQHQSVLVRLHRVWSARRLRHVGHPGGGKRSRGRTGAVTWTDKSGNLWLFGGSGFDAAGTLGELDDIWEFNPSTNEWAWMNGSSTLPTCGQVVCSEAAVYGTMGTPAAGNTPGGRDSAVSWLDKSGNLWLFGGWSVGNSGQLPLFNDLWEYDPSTAEWTWMGGSDKFDQPGVYGTLGQAGSGNTPGARNSAFNWTDGTGNLWLALWRFWRGDRRGSRRHKLRSQ